jgi:tyrosyl-tRNA synthetase
MDIEKRMDLIREVGEEIVTEQELRELLQTKSRPSAYDGFEPSGKIHIAQGILRAININKMLKAGVKFKLLAADWHGWANNKLGGDLEKIQVAGDYMIEIWKASGLDVSKVEFVRSSDLINRDSYWKTVMQLARNSTLKRIVRCSQIMGRKSEGELSASQIFYPCMQAADIYELGCDITQLGMDQRKVNMLAREIGPKIGFWKPVVVSHHMVLGLSKPTTASKDPDDVLLDMKMSKSKPDSAIFMEDSTEDIRRKVNKAYCPSKETSLNPVLEYCKYMIFEKFKEFTIDRPAKFGGALTFNSYAELENVFKKGDLHPADLKNGVATYIDRMIEPVRAHFKRNAKARKLLDFVKKQEVTR